MLVRISTLEPWRREAVPAMSTVAHRQDGIEIKVPPYEHEVHLPPDVEDKWSDEELAACDLARPVPFVVPEGKQRVGARQFAKVKGVVHEVYGLEDVPPVSPPPTKAERIQRLLDDYGLTLADLKEAVAKK